ncbi:MAG: RDD family protein [Planctomyces sp.]|nr:RDD family protein [Planctomyces sp.]
MELIRGKLCPVVTPESLELDFEIGSASDRIVAFALDLFLIALLLVVSAIAGMVLIGSASPAIAGAAVLVALFVIRQGYFLFFELRNSGTTPGKRNQGLRVVARDGGPLTGEMIVARNLLRDVEFFLPITVLFSPASLLPGGGGLIALVGILWLLIFLLFPWFNRYRMRCGDLIAGTVVIRQPSAKLLPDVAVFASPTGSAAASRAKFDFTAEQLSHYGIRELEVLEDLFRRLDSGRAPPEIMAPVCEKICRKIQWGDPPQDADALVFLREFYRAQRGHLERRLLFGARKEHKSHVTTEE